MYFLEAMIWSDECDDIKFQGIITTHQHSRSWSIETLLNVYWLACM